MKILFAGSPHSSAQILGAMSAMDLQIIGVISQPDKRSKRAKGEEPSHVSSEAARLGIPLYKPKTIDEKFKAKKGEIFFTETEKILAKEVIFNIRKKIGDRKLIFIEPNVKKRLG